MTVADVVAPIDVDRFRHEYLGQQHVVIKGRGGRFRGLLSWQMLDETLSRLRANDDRIYLVKNGHRIPRDAYVRTSQSGRVQYLIGPALIQQITDGSSLVINQVDEVFDEIRLLAESCEREFQTYVAANLYAGWGRDRGFDVHWDAHDTLIVQVIGRKAWKVWRPTRSFTLAGDGRDVAPLPSGEPNWQGTLEDGDTLYMPRGWWHVAEPLDEPSVHVTFGVTHKTGMDFLGWAVQQTRVFDSVRMDVPHWKSSEERRAWARAVRDAVDTILSEDAVETYMESVESGAHTRPIVRLPRGPARTFAASLEDQTRLRLVSGNRLFLHHEGESVVRFTVSGLDWRCADALAPALSLLTHNRACTLADMRRTLDEPAKPLLRPFVTALVTAGVVWTEPTDERLPVGRSG